jgi:multidrug efflux pump subunit AcrA (membrane-fusion protein)
MSTRTIQAEIYIPNLKRLQKPGMFTKVELTLSEKTQALVIPRIAILEEAGEKFVFTVQGGRALRKRVLTGFEKNEEVEILEGLSEGQWVVIRGQESLKDQATVKVIEGG